MCPKLSGVIWPRQLTSRFGLTEDYWTFTFFLIRICVDGGMTPPKTIFVVGAGAGAKFGFPTGDGLADQIAKLVDWRLHPTGDIVGEGAEHYPYFRDAFPNRANEILRAGPKIRSAIHQFTSIDEFLHSRRDNDDLVACGKAAIADVIQRAEGYSFLSKFQGRDPDREPMDQLKKTWIAGLFKRLTSGVSRKEVATIFHRIGFVIFNYDRCVEHALFHLVRHAYDVGEEEAREALAGLQVAHPYGSLGRLPWQGGVNQLPFGSPREHIGLIHARIRTYREDELDNDEVALARRLMADATNVVFLGFGFHPQNMRILDAGVPPELRHRGFTKGTAFKISPQNRMQIIGRIGTHVSHPLVGVELLETTCEAFIEDNAMAFDA